MIGNIIIAKKALFFVGGVAVAVVGSKVLKSDKTRKLCVNGLAGGMRLRDKALETFHNIKEEATDIYHDAKKKSEETE